MRKTLIAAALLVTTLATAQAAEHVLYVATDNSQDWWVPSMYVDINKRTMTTKCFNTKVLGPKADSIGHWYSSGYVKPEDQWKVEGGEIEEKGEWVYVHPDNLRGAGEEDFWKFGYPYYRTQAACQKDVKEVIESLDQ